MVSHSGNILNIQGNVINLPDEIRKVVQLQDVVIVLVKLTDKDTEKNVLGFDLNGNKIWEIDVKEGFVGVWEVGGNVYAREYSGDEYKIDIETGSAEYVGWGGK